MGIIKILFVLILLLNGTAFAKLGNTVEENQNQYGSPVLLETFPGNSGFTGYITYDIDDKWKLKAFFIDNEVRIEHLVQQKDGNGLLTRSEVRDLALKMFSPNHRGSYKRQVNQARVEGHFFDKGLIAYEYFMNGNKKIGYKAVKVLFYENNKTFVSVNPKAYL
jgi:hypothetical protein